MVEGATSFLNLRKGGREREEEEKDDLLIYLFYPQWRKKRGKHFALCAQHARRGEKKKSGKQRRKNPDGLNKEKEEKNVRRLSLTAERGSDRREDESC